MLKDTFKSPSRKCYVRHAKLFSMKNNRRSSVMELCAWWFKFTTWLQQSWAFLCTEWMNRTGDTSTLNHTQDISKFIRKIKFQCRSFYLALVFSPKFDLHYEKSIWSHFHLATGHVVVLQVTFLASRACGEEDIFASNQATGAEKSHSKASHILDFPSHHPHASVMHPHALREHGDVRCN